MRQSHGKRNGQTGTGIGKVGYIFKGLRSTEADFSCIMLKIAMGVGDEVNVSI